MSLKPPGIITFMLSVIMVVVVLISKYFSAAIPGVNGNEFYVLLLAHFILVLGCMLRGM